MKPAYIITKETVVIFLNGQNHTLQRGADKTDKVIEMLRNNDFRGVEDFLCPGATVPAKTGNLFTVNELGQVFVTGDTTPIHQSIAKKLLAFIQEGLPCQALVAFWNNLKTNPSEESINQLYDFLEKNHHPITPDGYFIAYKKVTSQGSGLVDSHTKTFNNSVGAIATMDRQKVDSNPNQTCSHGLHVASHEYAEGFSGDVLVVVKVNPSDVVAVPTDYNQQKMRVCKYEVISRYGEETEIKEQLVEAKVNVGNEDIIDLSNKKASEIITLVKQFTGQKITLSLKNKQAIVKKAVELLTKKGLQVKGTPSISKRK